METQNETQPRFDITIIILTSLSAIVGVCVLLAVWFPSLAVTVDSTIGISLGVLASFLLGALALILGQISLKSMSPLSRSWRAGVLIALVVILALSIWGAVHIYQREVNISNQIFGQNMWKNSGFEDPPEIIDFEVDPNDPGTHVVPDPDGRLPTWPCADSPDEMCTNIIFSGLVTNDTRKRRQAVRFILTVNDRNFETRFAWNGPNGNGNCFNNPVTIERGQSMFILFNIPSFRVELFKQFAKELRTPTFTVVDTNGDPRSVLNEFVDTPEVREQQMADTYAVLRNCPRAWSR